MDSAAIIRATAQVIEGAVGSVRAMPAGELAPQAYDGMTDDAMQRRTIVQARYDVQVDPPMRTNAAGHQGGAASIYQLNVRVQLSFSTSIELDEARRQLARARANDTVYRVCKALCFPGNVSLDATAVPTDIVSGCYTQNGAPRVTREDWGKRIYRVEIPLKCLVHDFAAVV